MTRKLIDDQIEIRTMETRDGKLFYPRCGQSGDMEDLYIAGYRSGLLWRSSSSGSNSVSDGTIALSELIKARESGEDDCLSFIALLDETALPISFLLLHSKQQALQQDNFQQERSRELFSEMLRYVQFGKGFADARREVDQLCCRD